jgi:cytochrome c553
MAIDAAHPHPTVTMKPSRRKAVQYSLLGTLVALAVLVAPAAADHPRDEYQSVLVRTPDRAHGMTLFGNCVRCHGTQGGGSIDGSIPVIAGQYRKVLAKQLVDFRHDKRWDAYMEHFADTPYVITTQDVADVVDYVSSLAPAAAAVNGDGSEVSHGADRYAQKCASCHGGHAEGNPMLAYPRLAGQHYPYLLRQLHDAVEGRRPNFPHSHVRLLAPFDRDDFVGIADFLSRIPPFRPPVVSATTSAR